MTTNEIDVAIIKPIAPAASAPLHCRDFEKINAKINDIKNDNGIGINNVKALINS